MLFTCTRPLLPSGREGNCKPAGVMGGSFSPLALFLLAVTVGLASLGQPVAARNAPASLATAPVRETDQAHEHAFDGVVQASRQTTVTAQVAGAIIDLPVRAGDIVNRHFVVGIELRARVAFAKAHDLVAAVLRAEDEIVKDRERADDQKIRQDDLED